MKILPVLDVMGGQVVRGVAGRRREYQPMVSRLTDSCQPTEVARAFAARFGLTEFYLADLDAIEGAEPCFSLYSALRGEGCRLWVDAGVRGGERARLLAGAGVETVVVGLETVNGPVELAEVVRTFGERIVFSLDLRAGVPLGRAGGWAGADAWSIAGQAVGLGVRRLLVLDLARVGVGAGTGTEELCRRLVARYPEVQVSAGGGVRGPADLHRLRDGGVRAALVASALHDGALSRRDLESL